MLRMLDVIAAVSKRLIADRCGVTAMEYGIITALLIAAMVGSLDLIGQDLVAVFTHIGARL